jgi:hypothetical protein
MTIAASRPSRWVSASSASRALRAERSVRSKAARATAPHPSVAIQPSTGCPHQNVAPAYITAKSTAHAASATPGPSQRAVRAAITPAHPSQRGSTLSVTSPTAAWATA